MPPQQSGLRDLPAGRADVVEQTLAQSTVSETHAPGKIGPWEGESWLLLPWGGAQPEVLPAGLEPFGGWGGQPERSAQSVAGRRARRGAEWGGWTERKVTSQVSTLLPERAKY